ncbi:MAG: tRNA (N(6)-L-threonylcarbamoyladenosine(37)-C(2))-methylthiotransferase MtaB [Dehalococcoidia bacterium]|nr:tRNA (N(6)-L-threonylcarbamoyladenosine(37)-C(2))-methylthiotransferase MtaB [Dehalococcoidia bacterium]|tara:strand:+ start:8480 stop:9769 length:1290 start_codon:yes stop_codon:yes gene_type:complete
MKNQTSNNILIHTHGCKLNQADSDNMSRAFVSAGYNIVDSISAADIYVLNTCTVTSTADSKARQALRSAHKRNPKALIVAAGCYSQRAEDELAQMQEVSLVVKNTEKDNIVALINNARNVDESALSRIEQPLDTVLSRCRAMVKIQEGCNQICSYCIVPKVRGREKSIPSSTLISHVNSLVSEGYKEVVLTGTQLGSYGFDLPGSSLPHLIERILQETEIPRLRVSSLQPQEISQDLLNLWSNERLCPHFHMPLQSGSNKILRAMRRKYTTDQFCKSVDFIRANVPNVAITGDLIIGFPGETDSDFKETQTLVSNIFFSNLHMFPYSKRPGTSATYLNGHVSPVIKKERFTALNEIVKDSFTDFRNKFLHTTQKVLWESHKIVNEEHYWKGITENYIRVQTKTNRNIRNTITEAKLQLLEDDCVWAIIR